MLTMFKIVMFFVWLAVIAYFFGIVGVSVYLGVLLAGWAISAAIDEYKGSRG